MNESIPGKPSSHYEERRLVMRSAIEHRVELLRDAKGIYGLGVAKEADATWRQDLILRPDRLSEGCCNFVAVLQMIIGGFRHGLFCKTLEECLRQEIHHAMLRRAGLPWPPPYEPAGLNSVRYWSSDPRQQIRNRQKYHGLRLGSLSIINRLIGQALEEAANHDAVQIARRFKFCHRYNIYRRIAQSSRAMDLAVTFPVLAFAIFGDELPLHDLGLCSRGHGDFERTILDVTQKRRQAAALVEAGVPLKSIAGLMGVPMAFRKVKPGAVDPTISYIIHNGWDKRLIHAFMPSSLRPMKLWLNAILRSVDLGDDFVEWVARHVLDISGSPDQLLSLLYDIKDWVRAGRPARIPRSIPSIDNYSPSRGGEFVVRPFSPDMSLRTVIRLSAAWHEAVANNMVGPNYEFPEPWCGAGSAGNYEIIPITNSGDLYREGHAMHHCVGTQGDLVRLGSAYFYSVRQRNERTATLELLRHGGSVWMGQLRGPCNSKVCKEIARAVRIWLGSQKEFRFPSEPADVCTSFSQQNLIADDDLPF